MRNGIHLSLYLCTYLEHGYLRPGLYLDLSSFHAFLFHSHPRAQSVLWGPCDNPGPMISRASQPGCVDLLECPRPCSPGREAMFHDGMPWDDFLGHGLPRDAPPGAKVSELPS